MVRIDITGCIVPDEDAWIYEWFGMEYTSTADVKGKIQEANGAMVDIYINSGGGDIFAGSEIYSEIRSYPGPVKIHVTGLAASAASVIACAGESEISPTAMLMVHNVSCNASGDYHVMDKQSDILKKANETIAAAYVEKTGRAMQDALEMMDKETWLAATDAVEKGLIDKIAESKNVQLVASFNGGMLPRNVIEKMRNQRIEEKANADFLCAKKTAQAKLNQLKLGGIENE